MSVLIPVHLHVQFVLAAPIERVWSVLGDFRHPELGSGFLAGISGEGAGIGATRVLHLTEELGGGAIEEVQSGRDDAGYYYAYELVGEVPFPIDSYYATVHAVPLSSEATMVVWTNRYHVSAEHEDEQCARSRSFLELIETNLRRVLGL
jgi:hypothetical protein